MTGVFSWIAKQMDAYRLGWAEAFFIGLLAAGFVTLIVSVGLIGWRFFNPIMQSGHRDPPKDVMPQITEEQVNALISAHLSATMSELMPATFATHAQMHAQDEKIIKAADEARAAMGTAQLGFENSKSQVEILREEISKLSSKIRDMERDWESWTHQQVQSVDRRFRSVDGGFRAIHDRERISKFSSFLEIEGSWLSSPQRGEVIPDWGEWETRAGEFNLKLESWLELAEIYRPRIKERVMGVDTQALQGAWEEDRLIPANLIASYRLITLAFRRFMNERQNVGMAVHSAAFSSPSTKENPNITRTLSN